MAYEVITLNLIPSGDIPVIHAAQYDVDRPLKFALKLGEDDFNPSGHTLELQIRKVDNNIVTAAPDDVTGNVVTFNSTEQMCACSGTNLGEIQIRKDDLDIATLHFYLVIQRDVLAGGLTSQSEIHDLADQIAEIVPEVIGDEYYTAAEVDEKIAEIPTFDPSNYYDKTQLYTKTETNGLLSQKANTSSLANVAFSGSYTDLNNTPDIPDVSDYYTKEQTYSQNEVNTLLGQKADTSSLAAVATSGDYSDLLNKPTVAEYGTDLPMSSTDPDKVADRITALETSVSGKADTSDLAYKLDKSAIKYIEGTGQTDTNGIITATALGVAQLDFDHHIILAVQSSYNGTCVNVGQYNKNFYFVCTSASGLANPIANTSLTIRIIYMDK